MKKYLILLLMVFSNIVYAQSQVEDLALDLMQEYDPQGYGYYQYNDGIKTQGKHIAQSIADRLSYYNSLSEINDPTQLVSEFNSKMNNIDLLEKELDDQGTNYLNNQASELGNQLNSGDYTGALYNIVGSIEGYSEIRKAEKELAIKRAELQRQKQAQMSEIYRKKFLYTKQVIGQLRQRAAFAASKIEETYYLASIDYVWCSYYSSYCDKPQKPADTGIENKFVARDVLLKQIAERKLRLFDTQQSKAFELGEEKYYLEEGIDFFLEGAIAFAAKAATENPTASNYVFLASLQANTSNILAFSSILVAQSLDANAVTGPNKKLYNDIKEGATSEIDQALRENNTKYLDAFLKAGLDKTIRFDGKSLLIHAISIDNPDAVQLILNHYIEGLNQDQVNEKVQKAIMLSAAQDSPNTIKRFMELGVPTEFTLANYTPIALAANTGSGDAMQVLIANTDNPGYYKSKYATSLGMVLVNAQENPTKTKSGLEELSNEDLKLVLDRLISGLNDEPNYFTVIIGSGNRAKNLLKKDPILSKKIEQEFVKSISLTTTIAANYVREQLVDISVNSFYGDYTTDNPTLADESLPYVAAYFENPYLWGALDEKLDLSQVKNRNGVPLVESLKAGGEKFNSYLVNKEFGVDPLENWISTTGSLPSVALVQSWTDPITYRNNNGGTLLHVYIELQKNNFLIGMPSRLVGFIGIGVDQSVRNKDGKTVYDLLMDNQGTFKDKYEQSFSWKFQEMSKKEKKSAINDWWDDVINSLK